MKKKLINPDTVFNSLQYGFSQAVQATGTRHLFLSGQVGVDARQITVKGGIEEQTRMAVDNISKIMAAAGGGLEHVTMLRLYIKEGSDSQQNQEKIAKVLLEKFAHSSPASSWIIVSGLSLPEWLIEIEAQALLPD